MSPEQHRIDEARARKGHAAYVEGYRSPLVVEAERAYQRLRKRRQRAAARRTSTKDHP